MSFVYRYKKYIVLAFFFVFVIGSSSFYIYQKNYQKKKIKKPKKILLASNIRRKKKSPEEDVEMYKVDIKGEVVAPGLYSLKAGSRVSDVIAMAGGLTNNGDTTVINLSKKISDEMVIIVYSYAEVEDFKRTKEVEKQVIDNCQENSGKVTNNACVEEKNVTEESSDLEVSNGQININTATKEQLQTLPGIGEAKAENILKYREEHQQFTDINQLKEINGIGDAIFNKLKDKITI